VIWKENLRTPSFRGVRFFLWNSEREGGRNTVTHEFLGRDVPYTEDVSRTPNTFSIEAFFSGFDYFRQRDRLIKALETPGPGELVHPYYGTMQVNVTRYRVRETGSEGNIVRFSIDFVEAGSLVYPSVETRKGGLLSDISDKISSTAVAKFLKDYSIADYPQFVIDSVTEKVEELASVIEEQSAFITRNADEIADLAVSISDLRGDIDNLINEPAILATRMISSLQLLSESVENRRESFDAYENIFSYGDQDPNIIPTTASRIQQDTNNQAFTNFVRVIALSEAVNSAFEIAYESEEDALQIKNSLYDEIDILMEAVDDDSVFAELNNLRTFVSLNIPPEDENLPKIFDYINYSTRPSLVIAYEIFGDVISDQDIIDRNHVKNPSYVPGGQTLRVLGRV
jgi:prophage DNA circulation protein